MTSRTKATKRAKEATSKTGRNQDGTYKKGYSGNLSGGGRPVEELSFRRQVKLRAQKDPAMVQDAIDTLIRIANSPDNPQCINAIDKLIKLNGNYDPTEAKVEASADVRAFERPLAELNIDELKKLLGEKS